MRPILRCLATQRGVQFQFAHSPLPRMLWNGAWHARAWYALKWTGRVVARSTECQLGPWTKHGLDPSLLARAHVPLNSMGFTSKRAYLGLGYHLHPSLGLLKIIFATCRTSLLKLLPIFMVQLALEVGHWLRIHLTALTLKTAVPVLVPLVGQAGAAMGGPVQGFFPLLPTICHSCWLAWLLVFYVHDSNFPWCRSGEVAHPNTSKGGTSKCSYGWDVKQMLALFKTFEIFIWQSPKLHWVKISKLVLQRSIANADDYCIFFSLPNMWKTNTNRKRIRNSNAKFTSRARWYHSVISPVAFKFTLGGIF